MKNGVSALGKIYTNVRHSEYYIHKNENENWNNNFKFMMKIQNDSK